MFILETEKYRNDLVQITNASGLPVSVIYFVAKDFFNEIERVYVQSLTAARMNPPKDGLIDMHVSTDGDVSFSEHNICENENEQE